MEKLITKNEAATVMAVIDSLGLDSLVNGSLDLQTLTHESKADFVRLLPKMIGFLMEYGKLWPDEKLDIRIFINSLCVICQDEAFILENTEALWDVDKLLQVVYDTYNETENKK